MCGRLISSVIFFLCGTAVVASPKPPVTFIENSGQWPGSTDFGVRLPGANMAVQSGLLSFTLMDMNKVEALHEQGHHAFNEESNLPNLDETIDAFSFQTHLLGAMSVAPQPLQRDQVYYNFFTSSDPCLWKTGVSAYHGVLYSSVYRGIDWKVYAEGSHVKYDYIVAPGADPSCIAEQLTAPATLDGNSGDLIIQTSLGEVIVKKPVAYQWVGGQRVSIACQFAQQSNVITYVFPNGYDTCHELIIDPLLIFSTYSGSRADNWGSTATPGEKGTLYSAGVTTRFFGGAFSGEFPVTTGAFQLTSGGLYDIGILKYDSTGSRLLYASYLGGNANESAHSLVVNQQNDLIVLGTTSSTNFPTTEGVYDRSFNGGLTDTNVVAYNNGSDIFVACISASGSALLASTYLGGSANDGLNPSTSSLVPNYGDELRGDIITDASGNIYISTVTSSANFPVTASFDVSFAGGGTDALILQLNASLTSIIWGAFLGGDGSDASHTIQIDKSGRLFVGGGTNSTDFPTTQGVYQAARAGDVDGWIACIAPDGSSLVASTLTGTTSFNQVYFLGLDSDDNVYVYGQTVGAFPVTAGTYSNPNSGQFIQKFNSSLTQLMFSTVFGSGRGIPDISPTAFLVNDCNNLYMTGWGGIVNSSTNNWQNNTLGMPVSADAFQSTTSGSDFYFMVLTSDASRFLYGTYMGGNFSRTHVDGGTSRFDRRGVVYHAVCSGCRQFNASGQPTSDFPVTPNAWSKTNNSPNCNNAAFKFDLSSLLARLQTNNVRLSQPGFNRVCLPDQIVFQNLSIGGKIFQWNLGDGTRLTKSDTAAIVHAYKTPGRYTVRLKAFDDGTCLGTDSTFAIVDVFKPQGVAGDDTAICFGSSFNLPVSGGATYRWEGIGNDLSSQTQNPVVSPLENSSYKVTITDVEGCVKVDTVRVSVVPGIDLKFNWRILPSCETRPVLEVTNLTNEAEETFWDFGDGTTTDARNAIHEYAADSTYSVRLVGKKEFCVYDQKVDIPIYTMRAPNVITPDQSPGKNDTFVIRVGNRDTGSAGVKVSLVIVNRWGERLYESNDYDNSWSGQGLSAGVYYYEAKAEGFADCRGWVQIIR